MSSTRLYVTRSYQNDIFSESKLAAQSYNNHKPVCSVFVEFALPQIQWFYKCLVKSLPSTFVPRLTLSLESWSLVMSPTI
jgi:hypothetical protein